MSPVYSKPTTKTRQKTSVRCWNECSNENKTLQMSYSNPHQTGLPAYWAEHFHVISDANYSPQFVSISSDHNYIFSSSSSDCHVVYDELFTSTAIFNSSKIIYLTFPETKNQQQPSETIATSS